MSNQQASRDETLSLSYDAILSLIAIESSTFTAGAALSLVYFTLSRNFPIPPNSHYAPRMRTMHVVSAAAGGKSSLLRALPLFTKKSVHYSDHWPTQSSVSPYFPGVPPAQVFNQVANPKLFIKRKTSVVGAEYLNVGENVGMCDYRE